MSHKNFIFLFSIIILSLTSSCKNSEKNLSNQVIQFDKQAHRGGRGLLPENTIMSEKLAIDHGMTMEMDLQMTKDKKIVVSHDAFLNHLFVLKPNGDTIPKKNEKEYLIYNMTYDSLVKYDVGLKPHPDFPQQKNIPAVRPLLSELIDSVETYAKVKKHTNHYNIEIKSSVKADGIHYPNLEEYVDSVISIINRKGIASRSMIQSFDIRALQRVHKKWPKIRTSYLVWGEEHDNAKSYIKDLGFKPDVFSPNYNTCTPERVKSFHEQNIKVIPWTVNEIEKMEELIKMGVDGMITDYPDKLHKL